jgi:hypothetical protein
MEGIFTLPYSEYEAIRQLQGWLPKQKGYSLFIPVSRQQKGVDFVLHSAKSGKFLTVQLKSSRAYIWNGDYFPIRFWFTNFIKKYKPRIADLYLFFCLYPVYSLDRKVNEKVKSWQSIILIFRDHEMLPLLKKVKTKRGRIDYFISFGIETYDYEPPKKVIGTRGRFAGVNLTKHLIENRITLLKRMLR